MTARELGKLGAIRGSKVGGNITKTLMELGKQRLQQISHEDIDSRIARDEAEADPADSLEAPKRPPPMF